MMRSALAVMILLLLTTTTAADDWEGPPALDRVDVLQMAKLAAERQAIQLTFDNEQLRLEIARLQAELGLLKLRTESPIHQRFNAKVAELQRLIDEAAQKAGLSPSDGWRPDLDKGVWTKPKP